MLACWVTYWPLQLVPWYSPLEYVFFFLLSLNNLIDLSLGDLLLSGIGCVLASVKRHWMVDPVEAMLVEGRSMLAMVLLLSLC